MNCQHFQDRMQIRLDDRLALEDDHELVEHANGCDTCSAHLRAWQTIESVVGLTVVGIEKNSRSIASMFPKIAAVAASALVGFSLVAWNHSESNTPIASVPKVSVSVPAEAIDVETTLELARWLESVRASDWFAQTMPTMRNVQQGVAPLGKSLRQVVSILTAGGLDSIESVHPVDGSDVVVSSSQTS